MTADIQWFRSPTIDGEFCPVRISIGGVLWEAQAIVSGNELRQQTSDESRDALKTIRIKNAYRLVMDTMRSEYPIV